MRLFIMRHAIATPRDTPGFARDADRPLTEEGRAQARDVATGLKWLKVNPDVVLSSPYLRAAQTAEEVVRVLKSCAPVKMLGELRAEAEPSETSKALADFSACEEILCVGHEPHVSAWLAYLVAGRQGMQCLFKKGGVACVEVERMPLAAGRSTLRWLMTPKHLTALGKITKAADDDSE